MLYSWTVWHRPAELDAQEAKRGSEKTRIEENTAMTKRNIFGELMEGVEAMKSHRGGKLTRRSFKVEPAPLPKVDAKLIRGTRQKLGCSRAMFARQLRINLRTLKK